MDLLIAPLTRALGPPSSLFSKKSTNPLYDGHCLAFAMQQLRCSSPMSLWIEARANTRTESAKVRNLRMRRKYSGTPTKPRLSVFCSNKQLYALLVDDQNRKTLFYASTLQKSIRDDPSCSTIEAAQKVGEELVKACKELDIAEISSYDRNGFARGERMVAFEIAISEHGFLPR